jgi:HAD superfamily hydrolase (TIGR01509 family)
MSLPRRPRAVVFDLDGTLIDSEALVKDAHFAACAQLGVTMTDAQFLGLVGLHREANDVLLKGYYDEDFPLETFIAATRAHIGDRIAPLKAGAVELMDTLDACALPYGLATSSRRPWVDKHFAAHNLSKRFRAVVTRQDCVEGKPHPEPYINASRLLGAAPGDVLALEDSYAGVASAHAAGCMTVMVPDLLTATDAQRAQAMVLNSLHDVLALVR